MSQRVDISLVRGDDFLGPTGGDILCRVEVIDSALSGRDAVFSIIAKIEVHDKRAVNDQRTIYTQDLRLTSVPVEIRIPRDEMQAFTYSGQMIRIKLQTRLVIEGATLFDTEITEEQELKLGTKPQISKNTKSIIDPADAFNIFKNLSAIPVESRFLTIISIAVGCVVIAVNTLIGVHDQFSPEELTWIYSHVTSDGGGTYPLRNSLIGSGGLGFSI